VREDSQRTCEFRHTGSLRSSIKQVDRRVEPGSAPARAGEVYAISSEQEDKPMLIALALVLGIAWLLGFTVFHVASGLIHVLVILAVVALVAHFVGAGRSRRAMT
jgi:hypothetical protein